MTVNSPSPTNETNTIIAEIKYRKAKNIDELVRWLMKVPRTYVFGGMLRYIINPVVHTDFGDIDLIVLDTVTMDRLSNTFGYTFREVSKPEQSPRYFIAKSPLVLKQIHLVLMRSHAEVMQFALDGPQYDMDRVAFSEGRFYFDQAIGEEAIRCAINAKCASLVKVVRDLSHFTKNRPQIEQRHLLKLIQKGFSIIQ